MPTRSSIPVQTALQAHCSRTAQRTRVRVDVTRTRDGESPVTEIPIREFGRWKKLKQRLHRSSCTAKAVVFRGLRRSSGLGDGPAVPIDPARLSAVQPQMGCSMTCGRPSRRKETLRSALCEVAPCAPMFCVRGCCSVRQENLRAAKRQVSGAQQARIDRRPCHDDSPKTAGPRRFYCTLIVWILHATAHQPQFTQMRRQHVGVDSHNTQSTLEQPRLIEQARYH